MKDPYPELSDAIMRARYPKLLDIMGMFYHRDFFEDYGSPEGALQKAVETWPKRHLAGAVGELDQLLDPSMSDEELRITLELLDFNYWTMGDGLSQRDWLRIIRKAFAEATSG